MSKEMEIRQDCCNIWNNLKDKTQMIDCLIESKQQIADLESKLALYDEVIKEREDDLETLFLIRDNLEQQLAELKTDNMNIFEYSQKIEQQLAEKDEEIKKLQHCNDRLAQGIYHSYGEHFILKVKQDKISFAVEKLEKVKDLLFASAREITGTSVASVRLWSISEIFDNQIEELKKEMK